ncbi:MAG: TonB-dependent receptor [Caulobacteraceae bacterium]
MKQNHGSVARPRLCGVSMLALTIALGASAAAAQDTAPGGATEEAVEQVVVTASRVARTGFTAPTPTTVIGSAQIEQRAATNISTILYDVPAFRPSPPGSMAAANGGALYADLRGLGNARTLVLVDGRRYVPSAAVDLNQFPTILIDRTEVVTGGASAQWGSDAIAGVVNLILKNRFSGFQANVQTGISNYGDSREYRAAFLAGTDFMGGRGHVVVSGDYTNNGGTGTFYSRPWGRNEYNLITNPCPLQVAVSATCPTGGNGQPTRAIASNVHLATMTPGGLITSGPLRGIEFLPGGTPGRFTYGDYVGGVAMVGGEMYGNTFGGSLPFAAPTLRYSYYSHGEFEIAPKITAFAEGAFGYSHVRNHSLVGKDQGPVAVSGTASIANALVIRNDNAYLPAAIKTQMAQAGVTFVNMGRISFDLGSENPDLRNFTTRLAAGLKGELAGWKWDASYQYGLNRYRQYIFNDRIEANWVKAVDAVVAPAGVAGVAAGSIVCRSTLTAPNDGCKPANIFGAGSVSPAAHDYTYGTAWAQSRYTQNSAAANVTGEPFSTWAGPVSVAFGGEYRKEEQVAISDPISQANGFNLGNTKAIAGDFDVKEGYFEAVVPLAKDMAFAKSLDFNGAVRIADYSSVGSATTWKVGGTWDVNGQVRLRVGQSHDFRAPNINELYASPFFQTNTITDSKLGSSYLVAQNTVGNSKLQAEIADTFTAGLVATPAFLQGFQASVDYYDINMKGAISSINIQTIVTRCNTGVAGYCDYVTRDPATGRISAVALVQLNLSSIKTSGIDMEMSYRFPLSRFSGGMPGNISLRFLGSYLRKFVIDDTITVVDRAGEVGRNSAFNGPHFRSTGSITYQLGGFTGTAQINYVGGGNYDNTYGPSDILNNRIGSRTYLHLQSQYELSKHLQVFGTVNNAFNTAPPAVPNTGGGSSPFNGSFYDSIGRTFTIGVRYRH